MQNTTPFLTGFSTLLSGKVKRTRQAQLRVQRQQMIQDLPGGFCHQVREEIPAEFIEARCQSVRKRVCPNTVTFWAFLSQVLAEDGSCSRTVSRMQAWMRAKGLEVPSASTASYVNARQQQPESMLQDVHQHLCEQLERQLFSQQLWRGLRVKAVDATSVQAPDTPANQVDFPQPSGQAPGCGFPVVQLVGLIDLSHGGLGDFSHGDIVTGELRGYDQLEEYLRPGDLLLGDRLYSSYEVVARLKASSVEFLGRNHQARKIDFRRGRKISANERIVEWKKPRQQPGKSRLPPEEWEQLPASMSIRIIRTKVRNREGKIQTRYVITTLLDAQFYPADEVASLYHHRWEIELRFRDIKTTMGMEMLRTKSPSMLRKEMLMHLIVYNLIRLLMLKAAHHGRVSHRRISFKGLLQALEETAAGFEGHGNHPRILQRERQNLYARIAERIVAYRPGRNEPRKKKRRPKSYGWLQRPRHEYFAHFPNPEPPARILDEAA